MRVVKCSASAIGRYDRCPFSYFLHYILGMESKAGKSALQGNIVHRALELMIKLRLRGKTHVDPMRLLEKSWDKHIRRAPEIEIRKVTTRIDKDTGEFKEAADYKKCRVALETILADKHYNPYTCNPIAGEQWFAVEMPGPEWECYDQDGNRHQFAVRGYIDMVQELDEDTIEIVDWKTGARKDFHTQEPIDEISLTREVQPRLYHLAASLMYPEHKNIVITFYYTSDGGPITISLSQDDLVETIAMLHRFFTTISKDTLVCRSRKWTCRMCNFEKTGVCNRVWSDLHTLGGEYVEDRYGNLTYKEQQVLCKTEKV